MKQMSPQELYITVGKRVAQYCKEKGLSQLDLSLAMGYKSVSIVSGAEIYYNNIHFNLEHVLKISQILDVEFCEFFKPYATE
jgi:transcriptional regulator with XRE-family HTH domain